MAMCKPSYLRNSAAFDRCCLSSHNKVGLQRKPCSDVPLKLLGSRLSKRQPFVHVRCKRTTKRSLTVIKSCMGAFVGLGHMDVAHYDPGPLDGLLDHSVYPNFVLGRDVFQDPSIMAGTTLDYSQAVGHPLYADLAHRREVELAAFMNWSLSVPASPRWSEVDADIEMCWGLLKWAVTSFPWQAAAWFLLAGCLTSMGHGVGSEGQPLPSKHHLSSSHATVCLD